MQKVYRGMTVDGTLPAVGPAGRALGVRVPTDIAVDDFGRVHPRTGEMSVSPALRLLPKHALPKRLRQSGLPYAEGSDKIAVWTMGTDGFQEGPFAPGLYLRLDPDNPDHGFLEPDRVMAFDEYRLLIESTRGQWVMNEVVT